LETTGGEWEVSPFYSTFTDGNFAINRIAGSGNVLIPSGNVAIGTSSATQKLTLSGGASDVAMLFNSTDTSYHNIGIKKDGSQLRFIEYGNDGTTEGANLLVLETNGDKVGINTASPSKALSVVGDAVFDGPTQTISSAGAGRVGATINLDSNYSWEGGYTIDGTVSGSDYLGAVLFNTADTSGNGAGVGAAIRSMAVDPFGRYTLDFHTAGTHATEGDDALRMRIPKQRDKQVVGTYGSLHWEPSTSNLGIGTTAPSSNAAIHAVTTAYSGASGAIILEDKRADANPFIQVENDARAYNIQTVGARSDNFEIYDNTAAAVRLAIDSSGNVGIGTASPDATLHVSGNIKAGSFVDSSDLFHIQASSNGDDIWLGTHNSGYGLIAMGWDTSLDQGVIGVDSSQDIAFYSDIATNNGLTTDRLSGKTPKVVFQGNGNVLIGYTSSNGSYLLQVNSQIFATNATIATSDGRYKEDVQTLSNATDLVSRLNPVQFKWKAHEIHNLDVGKTDVGFIAQEVQEVLSDTDYSDSVVVTNKTDDEEYLGLGETKLIPLLTAALQEAITKIETLETKVAALEAA